MIERSTLASEVAYLEKEVNSIKTAQPFYDGQLKINTVSTANSSDFSITANFSTAWAIDGFVRFRNTSGEPPFARIIPVFSVGGTLLTSQQIALLSATRVKALYAQGSNIIWRFRYRVVDIGNVTLNIKYYAMTNDTGGTFDIYSGDWVVKY